MHTIKVRIYPGRVQLDGTSVPLQELQETLDDLYGGFCFELRFVCSFARPHEVTQIKQILGL